MLKHDISCTSRVSQYVPLSIISIIGLCIIISTKRYLRNKEIELIGKRSFEFVKMQHLHAILKIEFL